MPMLKGCARSAKLSAGKPILQFLPIQEYKSLCLLHRISRGVVTWLAAGGPNPCLKHSKYYLNQLSNNDLWPIHSGQKEVVEDGETA